MLCMAGWQSLATICRLTKGRPVTCPDFGNERTFFGNSRIPLGETPLTIVIYAYGCEA